MMNCKAKKSIQEKSFEPDQSELMLTTGTTDFKIISDLTSAVYIDGIYTYNYSYTSTAEPVLTKFPEENRMEITFNNNYGSKITLNNISENGKSFELGVIINGVATNPLPFTSNQNILATDWCWRCAVVIARVTISIAWGAITEDDCVDKAIKACGKGNIINLTDASADIGVAEFEACNFQCAKKGDE